MPEFIQSNIVSLFFFFLVTEGRGRGVRISAFRILRYKKDKLCPTVIQKAHAGH